MLGKVVFGCTVSFEPIGVEAAEPHKTANIAVFTYFMVRCQFGWAGSLSLYSERTNGLVGKQLFGQAG
jgi:hypothetical protein